MVPGIGMTLATLTTPGGRRVDYPEVVLVEDDSPGGNERYVDTLALVTRLKASPRCVELACRYADRFGLWDVESVADVPSAPGDGSRRFAKLVWAEFRTYIDDEEDAPAIMLLVALLARPPAPPAQRTVPGPRFRLVVGGRQ